MTRIKAFLIHFSISLLIFLLLLYFILQHWYPQPFFSTDGGWHVIRIIVGVDLVLGPLLTLIVFKPGKPGLKFDMFMIAMVQFVALSWGVWNSYNERPAAVIYTLDHFTPVPAYELAEQGIDSKKLQQYGDSWPVFIYSDIPENKKFEIMRESLQLKKPLYLLTHYYTPLQQKHASSIAKNAMKNMENYVADKPKLLQQYIKAMQQIGDRKNIVLVALHSRERWVTALFDTSTMKIIDTVDIDPAYYNYAQKIKRKKKATSK